MSKRGVEIRKGSLQTTADVEAVLRDAVSRLAEEKGIHQWGLDGVSWKTLSRSYRPEDFYLAYVDGAVAGVFALVDYDPDYWREIPKGESYFLHKLAVRRDYAGKGVADAMLRYAVEKTRGAGFSALRLDCHAGRPGLRAFYEKRGFRLVGEGQVFPDYRAAFYLYPVTTLFSPY